MAVDKGGMFYEIVVDNKSAADIQKFREDIRGARADFRAFKVELGARRAQSESALRDLDKLAAAADRAAAAARRHGTAEQQATVKMNQRSQAILDANAAFDKKVRADNAATVSADRNFAAERRAANAARQRAKAEADITRVIEARQRAELLLAAAAERGIKLSEDEAASLRLLTSAQRDLLNARRALSRAQDTVSNANLLQIQAETAALQRLAEAERTRITNKILAGQGKTPQGGSQAVADRLAQQAAAKEAAAEDAATPALNRRARAILALNEAFNRKIQAEDRATESSNRNFALERRGLTNDEVRASALSAVTKAKDKLRVAQERLTQAQAAGLGVSNRELFAAKLLSQEEFLLADAKERQQAATRAGDPELQKINAETEALRRQNKARQEALTQQVLASKGLDPSGKTAVVPKDNTIGQRLKDFFQLNDVMNQTDGTANRLGFTFRRLFGIFAAFAAVRLVIQFFRQAISEAVRFNGAMEQATLGVAGVVAAVGDVRSATGKAVDATTKLSIAQGIARDQVAKLRKDALATTATFEELADAFQKGIGPGLEAGLNIDQIREFTRQISIAAGAIGLSQNQLSEEIRSILSGTIKEQNTRIAAVLNISNEDIRNAKEAGTLFDFLQKKFKSFDETGKQAARILPGLFARVRDASLQILGAGAKGLADDLKAILSGVLEEAVKVSETTGDIKLNEELVNTIGNVVQGFRTIVSEVKRLVVTLGAAGTLKELFTNIGDIISFVAIIVSGIIEGAIRGVNFVLNTIQAIRTIIQNLTTIDILNPTALREALVVLTAIAAAVAAIHFIAFAFGPLIKLTVLGLKSVRGVLGVIDILLGSNIIGNLKKAQSAANGWSAATLANIAPLLRTAAIISAIAVAADQLSSNPLIDFGGDTSKQAKKLQELINNFRQKVAEATGQPSVKGGFAENLLVDADSIEKKIAATQQTLIDLEQQGVTAADARVQSNRRLLASYQAALPILVEFRKRASAVKDAFADTPDTTNAFILEQSQALEKLKDKLKEVREETERARDAALAQAHAIGVTGAAGQELSITTAALTERVKEHRDMLLEEANVRKQIATLTKQLASGVVDDQAQELLIRGKINALSERANALETARAKLTEAILHSKVGELLVLAEQADFEQRQNNATLAIQMSRAEILRLSEQQHDEQRHGLALAQQELELFHIRDEQETSAGVRQLQGISEVITAIHKERDALQELRDTKGLNPEETERLALIDRTLGSLNQQKLSLQEQLTLMQSIRDTETKRLQFNLQFETAKNEAPITTGVITAFQQSFDEVSDRFRVTVDIMRNAIKGFSDFAAQSIVSAFDPSDNTSIQERFARFLQQLALQIISTLIEIAVTAIVLNAASEGILGAMVQGLVTARGKHDGGPVAEGRHDGGRARRTHRKAVGFNEGGSPGARRMHGVDRPGGLHPADTVPLWADPTEWIIRGRSVSKAGADVIERINEGVFDPFALRSAVGLRGHTRSAVRMAVRGQGLVMGGSAGSVRLPGAAGNAQRSAETSKQQPVSILVGGPNEAEKFWRGGETAIMRMLAKNNIFPTRR